MYENPINVSEFISKELIKNYEDAVMYEVRKKLKVDVDKNELLRALQFDRGQYEKGYQDGKADTQRKGQWLINSDGYYPYCSICLCEPQNRIMTTYCPNCGAFMKG